MKSPAKSLAMRQTRYRGSGFTLIELLVVVSIIALLISILLPSLSAARQQARGTVCMSNLKRLGVSTALYLTENSQRFFPVRLKSATPEGEPYVNDFGRSKPRWQWFLSTGTGPVINPTAFEPPFGDGPANGTTIMDNDYFLCPSLRGPYVRDVRNGAYGYNYQYLGNTLVAGGSDGSATGWANYPVGEIQIKSPAATVLFGDSRGADPRHGKHSYTLDPPRLGTEAGATKFGPSVPNDGTIAHSPAEARHRGSAAIAFVDSHVERMKLVDLGYEVGPQGVVTPDLGDGTIARNRLWTGLGRDLLRTGVPR
jgi:prepilin-type N-terminal cleavage/methylation domain-containing protein/prepilin-type processing-associated H-X9-DG protein